MWPTLQLGRPLDGWLNQHVGGIFEWWMRSRWSWAAEIAYRVMILAIDAVDVLVDDEAHLTCCGVHHRWIVDMFVMKD